MPYKANINEINMLLRSFYKPKSKISVIAYMICCYSCEIKNRDHEIGVIKTDYESQVRDTISAIVVSLVPLPRLQLVGRYTTCPYLFWWQDSWNICHIRCFVWLHSCSKVFCQTSFSSVSKNLSQTGRKGPFRNAFFEWHFADIEIFPLYDTFLAFRKIYDAKPELHHSSDTYFDWLHNIIQDG